MIEIPMSSAQYKLFLAFVALLLLVVCAVAWWSLRSVTVIPGDLTGVVGPVDVEAPVTSGSEARLFEPDPGVRAAYASNPLVLKSNEREIVLAYEFRSVELKNEPQDRVRVMRTEDGLTFSEESSNAWRAVPEALVMRDGTYRRYFFDPNAGGLRSESSTDGVAFAMDDGIRYEVDTDGGTNPHQFGVSTYFVDAKGGVVLLYNSTINDEIVVNRAYAPPESNGMSFAFVESGILDGTLADATYADPHTIVLKNGDVWLVVMNQSRTEHPPKSRQGIIYAYVSRDDGETFELHGRLVGWDDFKEMEVLSLNDPKIVEFPDGTLRIYVAAMVEDATVEQGYRWDLVSASGRME